MNKLAALLRDPGFQSDIGDGFKSLLQGASNSAASTVSAPVDGIAWLLRQAGMNVDKPVGGSDWMAQQGLTAEPKNRMAGLLGEGLGGAAPFVASAKAPQIARGLLNMGDNLAVPAQLSKQAGVIGFPESMPRPEQSAAVKSIADDLANQLRNKGFEATVEHSGSVAGPSSYVKVFDPQTGRFVVDPFRISNHSKGPIQSQFVNEIRGDFSAPDFSNAMKIADDMRAMGPGQMMLKQIERNGKKP
jgi:hypothetical protein